MAGEGQADAQSSGEQGTWSECPEGDEATRDQPRAAPGWGGRPPAHSSGARGAPPRSSPPPRLPGCAVSSPRPALTLKVPNFLLSQTSLKTIQGSSDLTVDENYLNDDIDHKGFDIEC